MLVLPALIHVGGATVFADDGEPATFYVVADQPRIARDASGAPSVLLTVYSTGQGAAAQAGAPADATLRLDVDLGLADDARAAVVAALQPMADAASAKRGTAHVPVKLAPPTWSRCAASLVVGATGGQRAVADPAASVLTGALARFAVALGVDDGALFDGLFQAPTSGGLGASFDLAVYGRLPAVAVDADADAGAVYDLLRGAGDGDGLAECTESEQDHLASQGLNAQALKDAGVLRVRVDPASSGLGADAIAALERYAMDRFTAMVKARFFQSKPGPKGELVYSLRPRAQIAGSPLSLTVSGAEVLDWPLAPQTSNLLQGLAAADLAPRVRRVTLGDPFWDTLALGITAFADFTSAPIAFVQVDVEYDGGDATRPPFQASLVFEASGVTRTLPEPPPLVGGVRQYRYQTKIAYTGRDARVVSPWTTTDRFDLDVWALDPARLDVTVLAGDVDFTLVRSVVAALAFDEPAGSHVEHPLTLTADAPSASFVSYLDAPLASPARVTPTFYLQDGTTMVGEPVDVTEALVPVSLPVARTLQVSLLLSGDVSDVAQVLVELTYDDGNGYATTVDRSLATLDDLQRWTVPLRDATKTAFTYAVEVDYHHRAPDVRPTVTASGSQAIAIDLPVAPALGVVVHPELVDFAAVPLVTVDLAHDGATPARATLPFTAPTTQTWRAPLAAGEAASFTYAVTYHPTGRDVVALSAITSSATAVVIPTYQPPAADTLTIRVLGSAIDFSTVQSARVDVSLPASTTPAAAATATLTADAPSATLRLPLPAPAPTGYAYTTTFMLISGTQVTVPSTTTDVPLLVPRLP